MVNISTAPQIKSSADNPIAINSSGTGNPQQPAIEEFAKILERKVSETTSKRETNNATNNAAIAESSKNTALPEEDNAVPTTAMDTSSTQHLVNNLFIDATNPYPTHPLSFAPEPAPSPNSLMATSLLPTVTLPFNSLASQDNKLAPNPALLVNQMLQERLAQATTATSNFTYLLNDFWQIFDTADSAAYGKILPFPSGMSETIQINTSGSIFSGPHESISISFSLSHPTSAALLNTTYQNVQVDLVVGQPKWDGEFAQKIVWLATQQHQVAEIHLNPAHLGPVEVMLSITQDQATAQFLSPHVAVREAIEEALPRLRELMAENGIQLGNVMVGSDSFQQENKQQQAYHSTKNTTSTVCTRTEAISQIETTVLLNKHHGIVDTYA